MRTITRYVLIELCKVFLAASAGLTGLMIIVGLVKEATAQNLPLDQIVQLIPFILPDALRIALPVTMLLATTTVYGRMSGANEVIALKSAGISPVAILKPAWILATILSLVTVWLNDVAVSWGRNGARRVVIEAVEEIAYNMLRTQRCYSSPRFAIHVQSVDGRRLLRPRLTMPARKDDPAITITASEAELRGDRAENVLKVILNDAQIEVEGQATLWYPGVYEQVIPLRDASRAEATDRLPSWLSMRVIPGEIVAQKQEIAECQEEMALRASFQLLAGEFGSLVGKEWQVRANSLQSRKERLFRLYTEPHRRWAAGFSCLCFLWVGAPVAIWLKKSDFLTSFFLCFLPILIVYYPLLAYGVDGSKNGSIPAYSVWLGNAMLGVGGYFLLRKVERY